MATRSHSPPMRIIPRATTRRAAEVTLMNSRRLRDRYRHFLIALPLVFACSDIDLAAADDETSLSASTDELPLPDLASEKIDGGAGLELTVYEGGNKSGPPVVFIHGFTGSYLSWEPQLSGSLPAQFHVVAYDLRGHGASDKPLDAASYTEGSLWADDLAAVIRAKHLDRPVLVGWSYGGYVISDYLRKYGDGTIGGLVFVGAVTKNGTTEAAGFLTDEALAVFGDVFSADVQKSIDGTRTLTRMFASPLRGTLWERAYGSAMMVPPVVRAAMFNRVLDNDDVLAHIRVPTLVIHGADDRVVRVSAANHIAATVPGAKLLVYDHVGHAVQLDAPQRFERDLAAFVRATRRNQR
jgi:pimeloyl-ACP methyl ester carboxylesterase